MFVIILLVIINCFTDQQFIQAFGTYEVVNASFFISYKYNSLILMSVYLN